MSVIVTKHAEKRLWERMGLGKRAIQRAAETAFDKGIKHAETTGNLNKWVTSLYFNNKTAKKQDIDSKEYKTRKTINGRSAEVTMPWTEMLKDSFIRSLARDSQKLYKSGNQNFVDRTNRKIAEYQRTTQYYKDRFNILYSNVKTLLGRSVLRLLDGELITEKEAQKDLTNHQKILMMTKRQLAEYLCEFDTNQSKSKVETWLGENAND